MRNTKMVSEGKVLLYAIPPHLISKVFSEVGFTIFIFHGRSRLKGKEICSRPWS
jgi:hypothetical protein